MSCKECKKFQESKATSYIRVGNANVEVRACEEHLKITFNKINSHKNLLDACIRDEKLATVAILSTPTGEHRNKLTEINILRLQAISLAKE